MNEWEWENRAKSLGQALALESTKRVIAEQRALRMAECLASVACVPCRVDPESTCDAHDKDVADWCGPCLARAALEAADGAAVTVATAK